MRLILPLLFVVTPVLPVWSAAKLNRLQSTDVRAVPYHWTGMVRTGTGLGSGVVVQPNVFATAAHVVFDDATQAWKVPVWFSPGQHQALGRSGNPRNADRVLAVIGWDSYQARRKRDKDRGLDRASSYETFNVDFAVGYKLAPWLADGSYARTFVDDPDRVSLLRQPRETLLVGYPGGTGFMHATAAGVRSTDWHAYQLDEQTHYDAGNFWWAVYTFYGVEAQGGVSGGPVFVKGDDGGWLVNALLVGGSSERAVVRGIDAAAWAQVEAAARIAQSGSSRTYLLERVNIVKAVSQPQGVSLEWTPSGASAASYLVERRHSENFEPVGETAGAMPRFLDRTARPGTGYSYRVIPRDADANRAPPSPIAPVQTRGLNLELQEAFSSRGLAWITGGDVSVRAGETGIRTGDAKSMERSFLELSLIGPGTLSFDWSVSSEENADYANPLSPYQGEVYDAFRFFVNGEETQWISGEVSRATEVHEVAPGPHTFRWEYRKDPYTDRGEDAGFLQDLRWDQRNAELYFYGASAVDAVYRRTSWFGYYTYDNLPWSYSPEHGWLYLVRGADKGLWAYDPDPDIGWMYVSPDVFPHVFLNGRGWAWYYHGTGTGGAGRWFYILNEDRDIRTGPEPTG